MSLFSVRSERAFCEALDYDLRFRWFLDMDLVEPSFDHSTFTRNRERLLRAHVSRQFFDEVVVQADRLHLLSDEHFTVDGTLIEAAASLKSFRPKDEPPTGCRQLERAIRPIAGWTSAASSARTRRTRAAPIRMRGCTRKVRGRRPNCATSGTP